MNIKLSTTLRVAGQPNAEPIYTLEFRGLDPNPAEGPEAARYVRITLLGRSGDPLHFVDIDKVDLLSSLNLL